MEEKLKDILAGDERVVWQGCTVPRKVLQAPDRPQQLRLWAIAAAAMILTVAVLFPYLLRIDRPIDVLVICFVVINAVPLALALRPGMDQRDLERRSISAVTDRRVISIVKDNVFSLPLQDLAWEVVDRDGQAGSIRLGPCVTAKKHHDRADAVIGCTDEDTGVKGFVLYHIDKVDEVADLLAAPAVMH